jgi:hypothetical protein
MSSLKQNESNIRNLIDILMFPAAHAWEHKPLSGLCKRLAQNENETDFVLDKVRFIRADVIDDVAFETFINDNDLYMLGTYAPWLLSDITGIDSEVFEKMQKADLCEEIGMILAATEGSTRALYEAVVSNGSYADILNTEYGRCEELSWYKESWYVLPMF